MRDNTSFTRPRLLIQAAATVAVMLWAVGATGVQTASRAASKDRNGVTIKDCTVTLIEQAEVPAQEAGVLKVIDMKEGRQVSKDELLAQIDDAKTKMEVRVAEAKLAIAKEKSADDINIRYAKASRDVADADYRADADANRKHAGAVPAEALREKLMKYTEAALGIEKATLDRSVAKLEADEAQAELDAAIENINRHKILSPLNGMIVKIHRHAGEWVQPGDPVLHIIRMDHLWVEGFANTKEDSPNALRNRPVQVLVTLAGGGQKTVPGKVIFVDPNIQAGGQFLVRAEVQNIEDGDAWLLCPGLSAEISVMLK